MAISAIINLTERPSLCLYVIIMSIKDSLFLLPKTTASIILNGGQNMLEHQVVGLEHNAEWRAETVCALICRNLFA